MARFAFKRLALYEQHERACETLNESLGWLFYWLGIVVSFGLHECVN